MAKRLSWNEIEKLAENIKMWCIYDNGTGGYSFYNVEVDEKGNGQTFYTVSHNDGSVVCTIKDYTCDLWVEDADGNLFYYEDERIIDRWYHRFNRVIIFKNPESKVKEKVITGDYIKISYRNGEVKTYRFDDEEA